MTIKEFNPMHPGEFIKMTYCEPLGLGSNELARKLNVSSGTVSRLLSAKNNVSPEMALKLSKVLGRSAESWLLMQDQYDLYHARKTIDLSEYESISV